MQTSDIPSREFGGEGGPLLFLHANGYPPACYQPLIDLWKTRRRVSAMLLRPLWESARLEDLPNWHPLSGDLLRFLSSRGEPVVAAGHSLGGIVALRAALRAPEKFRALILLDPVLFIPPYLFLWGMIRALRLEYRLHPLVQGALKRRRVFDDLDTVFRGYRSRKVFRYFDDESLRAYIEGIVRPKDGGGYELLYPPEWEARIYATSLQDFDIWRGLPKLGVPTLILRGAETDTFLESAARLTVRKNPNIKIQTLEKTTHLLPLEKPREVFESAEDFLQTVSRKGV